MSGQLSGPILIEIINYSFSKWPPSIQGPYQERRKISRVCGTIQSVGRVLLAHQSSPCMGLLLLAVNQSVIREGKGEMTLLLFEESGLSFQYVLFHLNLIKDIMI